MSIRSITMVTMFAAVATTSLLVFVLQSDATEEKMQDKPNVVTMVTLMENQAEAVVHEDELFYLMFPQNRDIGCEFEITGPLKLVQKSKLIARSPFGEPVVPMDSYMYVFKPTAKGKVTLKRVAVDPTTKKRTTSEGDVFSISVDEAKN